MKPANANEFNLISDVERAAQSPVGPLTEKDNKSILDFFKKPSRLNRPWIEMGVE